MIVSKEEFLQLFGKYGFDISDEKYEKFLEYSKLLVSWNEKMNLTAITDPLGISVRHFLDSVLLLKYCDIPENAVLADVGTGAGFPAVPLKIYRNDIETVLIDSLNKRINFLKEVSSALELPMKCIHSRAEDGAKDTALREKFDVVTARAVAAMPVLCEYCLPYVKKGGFFAAMKGPNEDISAAENSIRILGGKIEKIAKYDIEGEGRSVIVVRKISHTPIKYPRNSAQISKKSL